MERREGVTGTVVRKEKEQMISISTGDIMHVMGSFGLRMDYTVRMKLRLADVIDGAILAEAVARTQRRYPYLSLRMCRNEQEFYYEQNSSPVVLLHTDGAGTVLTAFCMGPVIQFFNEKVSTPLRYGKA